MVYILKSDRSLHHGHLLNSDVKIHQVHAQHTATQCDTMQHTATHCSTLQHAYMNDNLTLLMCTCAPSLLHCITLQHTVTHRNTIEQHTATHIINQMLTLLMCVCVP